MKKDKIEVWRIGRHRLVCGDSMKKSVRDLALKGYGRPRLCLTDPPFGAAGFGEPPAYLTLAFLHSITAPIVVMTYPVDLNFHMLADSTRGWNMREICWVRPGKTQHVPILIFWRRTRKEEPPKLSSSVVVYTDSLRRNDGVRPRPAALWRKLIYSYSLFTGVVFDPFAGSGTTIFACESTQRTCVTIEIDRDLCTKIIHRAKRFNLKVQKL